jgi:L-fuconate dehydratase
VQHLSMFDFVAVSATHEGRMIEFVDHLHEHFVTPAAITDGHYVTPRSPGSGAEMHPESVAGYTWPRA